MSGKFLEVECQCGNKQIIFGSCAREISCPKCSSILAVPTGSRADIKTEIVRVLE
jgi:small subunit ribosomal protein S27e